VSDETGIQDTSPEETAVDDNQASGVNYHDRIRSEADFAVEEVQKKDRYIGELHEKATRFKPLEQYVDAVGADELTRLAGIGNQIETNPQLKQALQDAVNGATPKAEEPEEEEIFDPEIKALRSRYDGRIHEQDELIRSLQSRLNVTEAVSLKGSLSENMESALSKFTDDPVLLDEAQTEITRAVENLETAAKNGDRAAANQLEQLGGPMGSKTLRMMTIDIYDKFVDKRLEGTMNQPDGEVMLSKATDARTTTRSAMPTDTIAIKSGAKVTSKLVNEVMEQAARKLGKDPSRLFG
jgi:hypothetical protein